MPRFPKGEEYALLFDHEDNLVEDSPAAAIKKRRLQQAILNLSNTHRIRQGSTPTILAFTDAPKNTNKIWHKIIRGFHGEGLATFLTQVRVNRVPTGVALHRFHPDILASCHECGDPDTLRHRLLECPARLQLARDLPMALAQLAFKHSHYPWPDRPPPHLQHTEQLIKRNWPGGQISIKEIPTSLTKGPPLEALTERAYLNQDGSLNIKKFRLLNPFTPEDIKEAEELKPVDKNPSKASKSQYKSDRANLISIAHPSGDPNLPKHTIPITGFTHLWDKFSVLHPELTPKQFHDELYALLGREAEGATRSTGIEVDH
jgi:hypothetical protein